ncbi:MAG: hypothetical protein K6G85_07050 [Eubacterium sp.]|nr:hypothetical protein [Eubacterium sp.]
MEYTIKTNLKKRECVSYTKKNVVKNGWKDKAKYLGKVNEKGFKITVNPSTEHFYKVNSFSPVNVGTFEETAEGTTIHVKQRMDVSIIIFSIFWIVVSLGIMTLLIRECQMENDWSGMLWLCVPMIFLFGWFGGVILGFKLSEKKDMEQIRKLYEDYEC